MRAAQYGLSRHLLSASLMYCWEIMIGSRAYLATLDAPWQKVWRVTILLPELGRPGQAGRPGPRARPRQASAMTRYCQHLSATVGWFWEANAQTCATLRGLSDRHVSKS